MDKAQWRREHKARRAKRSPEELARVGEALGARDWSTVLRAAIRPECATNCLLLATAYLELPGEPPTGPLRNALHRLNYNILVPVVREDGSLAWGFDNSPLVRNNMGIAEPVIATADATQSAVLFIPALGVGRDGSRIGKGAGYYDRFLASVPRHQDGGPLRIAVVFDDEFVDSVPHDDDDQPIDAVLTEERLVLLDQAK